MEKPPEKPEVPSPAAHDPDMALLPAEEALVDSDGDISIHEVLCDLLEAVDIVLEEGTTPENFEERVYKALMEKMKRKAGENPMPPEPTNPTPPAPKDPLVAEGPPLYMSLEDARKIADPAVRQLAVGAALSLERLKALEGKTIADAKVLRDRRIERVARLLPAAQRDKLLAMAAAPSALLSLSADGTVADPLAATLELMEGVQAGLPELLQNPSAEFAVRPHPEDYTGQNIPEERRRAVVDELLRAGGMEPAHAK
jgi:hypothetical protein